MWVCDSFVEIWMNVLDLKTQSCFALSSRSIVFLENIQTAGEFFLFYSVMKSIQVFSTCHLLLSTLSFFSFLSFHGSQYGNYLDIVVYTSPAVRWPTLSQVVVISNEITDHKSSFTSRPCNHRFFVFVDDEAFKLSVRVAYQCIGKTRWRTSHHRHFMAMKMRSIMHGGTWGA